jgi:hypothetical protein
MFKLNDMNVKLLVVVVVVHGVVAISEKRNK